MIAIRNVKSTASSYWHGTDTSLAYPSWDRHTRYDLSKAIKACVITTAQGQDQHPYRDWLTYRWTHINLFIKISSQNYHIYDWKWPQQSLNKQPFLMSKLFRGRPTYFLNVQRPLFVNQIEKPVHEVYSEKWISFVWFMATICPVQLRPRQMAPQMNRSLWRRVLVSVVILSPLFGQKKRVCIVFVKLLRVWAICQAIQKGFGMSFGFQSQHVFIECVKGAFVSATVCGISNDSSFFTP